MNGINTKIESKLEIDFNTIFVETSPENTKGTGYSDLIPDPDSNNTFEVCDKDDNNQKNGNDKKIDFTDSRCKYNENIAFLQSEKPTFNDTKLKVNGDLSYGNLNNSELNGSVLYVTGDFDNGNQNNLF